MNQTASTDQNHQDRLEADSGRPAYRRNEEQEEDGGQANQKPDRPSLDRELLDGRLLPHRQPAQPSQARENCRLFLRLVDGRLHLELVLVNPESERPPTGEKRSKWPFRPSSKQMDVVAFFRGGATGVARPTGGKLVEMNEAALLP